MKRTLSILILTLSILTLSWYTLSYTKERKDTIIYEEPKQLEEEENHIEKTALFMQKDAEVVITTTTGSTVHRGMPNPDNAGSFINIGPFGDPHVRSNAYGNGATNYIEMHPTDAATMYLCARNGGLYKTVNYGKHWEPYSDNFCTGAYAVAVCKTDPTVIYLGGVNTTMWISTDEGESWILRNSGLEGMVHDIEIDPTNPDRALAATTNGMFLTTDQGISWIQKSDYLYTDINYTSDWSYIAITNNYANNSYHNAEEKVPSYLKSTDHGETWEEVIVTNNLVLADSTNTVQRTYIALYEPKDGSPLMIYAYLIKSSANSGFTSNFSGLYKSIDGDSSFQEVKHPNYDYPNGPSALQEVEGTLSELTDVYGGVNPFSTATWVSDFYVSPSNPDLLITMACKMWSSSDGGLTWQMIVSYGGDGWADRRYITTNNTQDSMYMCDDGGIWAVDLSELAPYDASIKHNVPKNGDICGIEASDGDISTSNKRVFVCGGQDVGQLFTRNGRNSHIGAVDCYRARICPFDDKVVITGGLRYVTIKDRPASEDQTYHIYDDISYNPFDKQQVFGFTKGKTIDGYTTYFLLKSPKGENGWSITNAKSEEAWSGNYSNTALDYWEQAIDITAYGDRLTLNQPDVELSAAVEGLAYLSVPAVDRVFRTLDISSETPTWTELKNAPQTISFYQLASHPSNENLVAIATKSGIYISRDKGDNWDLVKDIPFVGQPIDLVFDPTVAEGLYVASTSTVYYTDETLEQWITFDKGLPHNNITKIQVQDYGEGDVRLFVTKYGRGMWESPSYHSEHNNLPFPDFALHGTSSELIVLGETVQLADHTGNSEHTCWTIEHEDGQFIDSISNVIYPEFQFTKAGYYTVTLTATNQNGTATKRREQFIKVVDRFDQSIESHLYFDGVDDKVVWNDASIGQIDTDSAMTISGWFKFLDINMSRTEFIISKRSSTTNGIQIFRNGSNQIGVNMKNSNGEPVGYGYCTTRITDSAYHHLVLTIDTREGISEIYIDGNLEQRITDEDKLDTDATRIAVGFNIPSALTLGYNTKNNLYYFHGCVDDFFIYDRALSANQIQELYNKFSINDGLIYSYPMNDATTPSHLYDQRGGKDATIEGAIYQTPVKIPTPTKEIVAENINLYPNPCTGSVNIETPYDVIYVRVYNMNGAIIMSKKLEKGQVLEIEHKGLFTLDIEHNGKHYHERLLVK